MIADSVIAENRFEALAANENVHLSALAGDLPILRDPPLAHPAGQILLLVPLRPREIHDDCYVRWKLEAGTEIETAHRASQLALR